MRRILIVDDDPLIGQATRAWLKQHAYRVPTAGSGLEGLAWLERSIFDLLVVDVFMPNMRGFESIRIFHERAPKVPLIAISGGAFGDPKSSGPDFLRLAARRDALPAQAFQAFDPARCDRRLPVGGRAGSKNCRCLGRGCGRAFRTARQRWCRVSRLEIEIRDTGDSRETCEQLNICHMMLSHGGTT